MSCVAEENNNSKKKFTQKKEKRGEGEEEEEVMNEREVLTLVASCPAPNGSDGEEVRKETRKWMGKSWGEERKRRRGESKRGGNKDTIRRRMGW